MRPLSCAELPWRFASFVLAVQRLASQVNIVTQCIHILVLPALCACTSRASCTEAGSAAAGCNPVCTTSAQRTRRLAQPNAWPLCYCPAEAHAFTPGVCDRRDKDHIIWCESTLPHLPHQSALHLQLTNSQCTTSHAYSRPWHMQQTRVVTVDCRQMVANHSRCKCLWSTLSPPPSPNQP